MEYLGVELGEEVELYLSLDFGKFITRENGFTEEKSGEFSIPINKAMEHLKHLEIEFDGFAVHNSNTKQISSLDKGTLKEELSAAK